MLTLQPLLALAEQNYLANIRSSLHDAGVVAAVREHDTPALFAWMIGLFQFQGISDLAAGGYLAANGAATFGQLSSSLEAACGCKKLTSYWSFTDCNYRRTAQTCSRPASMRRCPLPRHPFRNGRLSQSAYSFFLFVRDICGGDLVRWIDERLEHADDGGPDRAARMRDAVIEPMVNIYGVSRKVLSMALADLMLAADPDRGRWVTTGASMIAIDTLVHNFLVRTGILRRHGKAHAYGPACYRPGGCADIIEMIADHIDAREFDAGDPHRFPRFIQWSIWNFCAQGGWNICNGNTIDDRKRCSNAFCPVFRDCARVRLG